ncbi:MAG: hypothetical protein CL908_18285 [Deltaproteobacteria bacterium]|nr:hypothetical protein [Deltaproteobacteria bacterium]
MSGEPSLLGTTATAIFGFLVVIAFFSFREFEERRFLLPLATAAFVLRAALVPIFYIVLVNAGLEGFEYKDSEKYHYQGMEFAREFERGIDFDSQAWRTRDPGFPLLTGVVYWIVGPNTLAVRMLNAVLSALTLLWIYRIARLAFDDPRVARYACYLHAFLPYPLTIVISHRKDILVALLATFLFYHALRLLRLDKDLPKAALWIAMGLLAISFFRSGFVLPFLGILFFCYVLTQRSLLQAIALSVPTALVIQLVQILISQDTSIGIAENTARLEGKLLRSGALAEVGGLVRSVRMTSIFEIYKLPFATALFTILPFPPYVTGYLPTIISSWAQLASLAFLPHMIMGAMVSFDRAEWRRRIPLLAFIVTFLALLAAIHIGVIRYRETVYPALLVLAGAGLARGGNTALAGLIYFGLALLGGLVLFVRYS